MISVLLVDDDHISFKLLDAFLTARFSSAFRCVHAATLEAATERLKRESFDVVFLDNRLHCGRDVRHTMPLLSRWVKRARLFVISACTEDSSLRDARSMGACEVIDKFELRQRIADGLLG